MSGSERHPWLNWDQVENFIGQKLPGHAKEKAQSFVDNMSWVENYVQEMLKKTMPTMDLGISSKDGVSIEVFETHEHVIAQVKLSKEEDARAIQIFVKSHQIKLTGFLNGKPRMIKLPHMVLPRTTRARYKQRILQIKVRKRGLKEGYHEAYIRF
jgi:HSP20 family molecular chaperone IbpA